jgi:hypothetical protein
MTPANFGQKLWKSYKVPSGSGLSYGDYVEQLTYFAVSQGGR